MASLKHCESLKERFFLRLPSKFQASDRLFSWTAIDDDGIFYYQISLYYNFISLITIFGKIKRLRWVKQGTTK